MDGSASSTGVVVRPIIATPVTSQRIDPISVRPEPQLLSQVTLRSLSQWLLDREHRPAFIVDDFAAVILMNRAARQLLKFERLVEIARGKLRMSDRKGQETFTRALGGMGEGRRVVRPTRKGVAMHLSQIEVGENPERLLLCVVESQHGDLSDCDQLRRTFRLTLAEAQVALAIFEGKSLVDAARIRRTSINTVKAQSQRVFDKCGVHSQVELVRRLARVLHHAGT